MNQKLLSEAFCVGFATLVFGGILWVLSRTFFPNADPSSFNYHIIILFLLGFGLHLIAEFSGVNLWYCKNGVACKK